MLYHRRRKDDDATDSSSYRFQVNDRAQWEATCAGHDEARENAQIKTVYPDLELGNRNNVHVIMDVPSVDARQIFTQQPENETVIHEAGHFINDADATPF